MPRHLIAGLAPGIELQPDYIVRITANGPTSGNTVSGVIVSDVSMQVDAAATPPSKADLLPPILAHEVQG